MTQEKFEKKNWNYINNDFLENFQEMGVLLKLELEKSNSKEIHKIYSLYQNLKNILEKTETKFVWKEKIDWNKEMEKVSLSNILSEEKISNLSIDSQERIEDFASGLNYLFKAVEKKK